MEDSKKKFIETVKQANNILVTVRSNPSIDHLSACIALSLMLNEMGKHATAVFSGSIPAVMDFLEPEKTLKTDTDSLQDFIISLDKVKADKLRYKVEDDVVKIFITPYKTSITSKDLEFSQGDFNVDVIVALGVHSQDDLDKAVTSHGRILHDAIVISLNVDHRDDNSESGKDELGSINWVDTTVSSLSEMLAGSIEGLEEGENSDKDRPLLDNQVATALLTGIVAETDRFGNSKTTPATMQTSATLLMAGANQELVATKLSGASPHASSISLDVPDEGDMVAYDSSDDMTDEPSDESTDNSSDGTGSKSARRRKKKPGHKNGQDSQDGDNGAADAKADEDEDRPDPIIDASVAIEHDTETKSEPDTENGEASGANDGPETASEDEADIKLETGSDDDAGKPEVINQDTDETASAESASVESATGLDLSDLGLPEVTGVRSDNANGQQESPLSPLDLAGGVSAIDPEGMVTGDGVVAPQVYDLNQISIPASIPTSSPTNAFADSMAEPAANPTQNVWPAPQAVVEEPAPAETQTTAEDQAVLNVLSQSKPIDTERTTIQPLRDQNGFVAQPPLLDKKSTADGSKHESVDNSLDPIKFAVTPPTLGGTLTAGHDLADETPSPDPMTNDHPSSTGRSIMTHDPHALSPGSDITQGLEAADSGEPRGVGELDPNAEPVEHNGLPQFGLIHDDKPADSTETKAVPPTKKHVINPLAGAAAPVAPPSLSSLVQLEAQENARQAGNPQAGIVSPPLAGPVQADSVDQALQAVLTASGK